MECLDKLNKRNKILVNRIIELDSQVQAQNKKIEDLNKCCIVGTSEDSHLQDEQNVISPIMQLNSVSKRVERLENNESDLPLQSLAKVSERVEEIENNINSHILLCRGPEVEEKVTKATASGVTNVNQIKAELCNEICGEDISEISVGSLSVSVYGKRRKVLKVECTNIFTRNFLLKQARIRKPNGIYVVEFLAPNKLLLYRKLLELKKRYQGKIKVVQIRNNSICYKLNIEDQFCRVNSLSEIEEIESRLTRGNQGNDGDRTNE